jgi:hypothetical protein
MPSTMLGGELGDSARQTLSDPETVRDRGSSLSDRRHIFTFSGVWEPTFQASSNGLNYLINHNQLAFIVNNSLSQVLITSQSHLAVAREALRDCPRVKLFLVADGPGDGDAFGFFAAQ